MVARRLVLALLVAANAALLTTAPSVRGAGPAGLRIAVSFPESLEKSAQDGRILLILSKDDSAEPRFQISDTGLKTQQVFGVDAEGQRPGQEAVFDASVLGYPLETLAEVPAGTYNVQALLHKYETFRLGDGRVLKLPMDRGEGQQWNRAPGNLLSTPRKIAIDPKKPETIPIALEIQHANPYYDDSYAVNSANLGPYGDAITYELIPYIEKKYRAIGAGWARFMYGGSTGGWESLGGQIFYPDEYNGCYAACPDPIDFRAYTVVDIYKDANAFFSEGPWKKVPRPGFRNYLGHLSATIEQLNRAELVLGAKGRSGQQWDIWEAVYSPVGPDGYPARIWDRRTGVIDKKVAGYWREHYDLSHILRRDWDKGLGKRLEGKINLYVGEADNYFLNNAVYLVEDFLKQTKNPPYGGEVMYGARAEHCWNGDPTRPNAISRLRYHQMYAPKIVERLLKTAPPGGDVKSWRY